MVYGPQPRVLQPRLKAGNIMLGAFFFGEGPLVGDWGLATFKIAEG